MDPPPTQQFAKSNQLQLAPRVISLPFDIMLLVLDAVRDLEPSSDAQTTLSRCARICRDMLRPSQVRLYSAVHISRRPEFEEFGRALLENPELALLVEALYADVSEAYNNDASLLPANEPLLPSQAIGGMTNLQKLSIVGLREKTNFPHSPVLEAFVGSFAASCPKLKILRLRKVQFGEYAGFVRQIASFPELETLKLSALTWMELGHLTEDEMVQQASSTELCSLEISLRKLPPRRPFWDFSSACWAFLVQTLILRISHKALDIRELEGLSAFHGLTHLELHFMNRDIYGATVALRSIKSQYMRTIHIEHQCRGMSEYVPARYAKLGLDEILAGPTFSSLTRVTWRLVSNQGEAQVWLAGLPRCFAGLAKRNILVCEWRFDISSSTRRK